MRNKRPFFLDLHERGLNIEPGGTGVNFLFCAACASMVVFFARTGIESVASRSFQAVLYRHAYSVPSARLTHALLRHACGYGCERRGYYDGASLTMRFPFSVSFRS